MCSVIFVHGFEIVAVFPNTCPDEADAVLTAFKYAQSAFEEEAFEFDSVQIWRNCQRVLTMNF